MGNTIIEKILLSHSDEKEVKPSDIINVIVDARVARDFGGANVVNNIENGTLKIDDPSKTYFTFDCNPGGSDQKYAANQHRCRIFAREKGIRVFDINHGIGTHLAIDNELVAPGGTFVSTDSHANIMGAIGAFGQGMGDQDVAATWANGKVWFKVPGSVKLTLTGKPPKNVFAKDIILGLLKKFGANTLLGYAVEIYGEYVEELTLSDRITISSMGTEMGAIALIFPPNEKILSHFKGGNKNLAADDDAVYEKEYTVDISDFEPFVSRPGHPEDVVSIASLDKIKIDSAFIGSCTNGRYEDLKLASEILKGKKVAPGVILKIVPSTSDIWDRCLKEGIIEIFRLAGALIGNAGCAGCAAGQIGQNGPKEITVSSGNRNFPGKQGKGEVYLASPATVAASALAGYITTADNIPEEPMLFESPKEKNFQEKITDKVSNKTKAPLKVKGRVWIVDKDNIDTDMIYHNRYLTIVNINEMGQYAFDNLEGWEDFSSKAKPGDIIITGKNFGCGSSRQQAVDCFKSLGISLLIAESFGAIYERNAINAAFPILTLRDTIKSIGLKNGDVVEVDFVTGELKKEDGSSLNINPFFSAQREIYEKGGLLK